MLASIPASNNAALLLKLRTFRELANDPEIIHALDLAVLRYPSGHTLDGYIGATESMFRHLAREDS